MEQKIVAVIGTTLVPLEPLGRMFRELVPEAKVVNFLDESILLEIDRAGEITPSIVHRYCTYAVEAERAGCDLIFNQCSSIGELTEVAQRMVRVPILRTDLPMAEEAVEAGERVAVVATYRATLEPTSRLIRRVADERGRRVQIETRWCDDAFACLRRGDGKAHNEILRAAVRELEGRVDAIVLAQGSMAALLPELGPTRTPVLTSPRSGVLRAKQMLQGVRRW